MTKPELILYFALIKFFKRLKHNGKMKKGSSKVIVNSILKRIMDENIPKLSFSCLMCELRHFFMPIHKM